MKKIKAGVTFDSSEFEEINTYGDYIRSLSDGELANWIYENIVKYPWKGTEYWTKKFGHELGIYLPKKPIKHKDNSGESFKWYECPNPDCRSMLDSEDIDKKECGCCEQVLDLDE